MVTPIRDIGNKSLFTSTFHILTSNIASTSTMDMIVDSIDDFFKNNCDNYDEVKDHSLAFSMHSSRSLSMSLSECDEKYLVRVQCESNNIVEDDQVTLSNSPQLEYTTPKSQGIQVSKAAGHTSNTGQRCVESTASVLNNNAVNDNNVFNIQLNYDINQALDPES